MPGKASVSSIFRIRYNPLKNKGIAVGKRLMTPLFHFLPAGSQGKFSIHLWRWFHRIIAIRPSTIWQKNLPQKYELFA
jgi:hypothetical protein